MKDAVVLLVGLGGLVAIVVFGSVGHSFSVGRVALLRGLGLWQRP